MANGSTGALDKAFERLNTQAIGGQTSALDAAFSGLNKTEAPAPQATSALDRAFDGLQNTETERPAQASALDRAFEGLQQPQEPSAQEQSFRKRFTAPRRRQTPSADVATPPGSGGPKFTLDEIVNSGAPFREKLQAIRSGRTKEKADQLGKLLGQIEADKGTLAADERALEITGRPLTTLRAAAGGLTMGLSDPVFKWAEEKFTGDRVTTTSGALQFLNAVTRMGTSFMTASTLMSGMPAGSQSFKLVRAAANAGKAGGITALVNKMPAVANISKDILRRVILSNIMAGGNNVGALMTGDKTLGMALKDQAVASVSAMATILPETFVRAGGANIVAQVATDFAVDVFMDSAITKRLKIMGEDSNWKEWLLYEIPTLAQSLAMATADYRNPDFAGKQRMNRAEFTKMRQGMKSAFKKRVKQAMDSGEIRQRTPEDKAALDAIPQKMEEAAAEVGRTPEEILAETKGQFTPESVTEIPAFAKKLILPSELAQIDSTPGATKKPARPVLTARKIVQGPELNKQIDIGNDYIKQANAEIRQLRKSGDNPELIPFWKKKVKAMRKSVKEVKALRKQAKLGVRSDIAEVREFAEGIESQRSFLDLLTKQDVDEMAQDLGVHPGATKKATVDAILKEKGIERTVSESNAETTERAITQETFRQESPFVERKIQNALHGRTPKEVAARIRGLAKIELQGLASEMGVEMTRVNDEGATVPKTSDELATELTPKILKRSATEDVDIQGKPQLRIGGEDVQKRAGEIGVQQRIDDIDNMKLDQLKANAKDLGIDSKGTAPALKKRLKAQATGKAEEAGKPLGPVDAEARVEAPEGSSMGFKLVEGVKTGAKSFFKKHFTAAGHNPQAVFARSETAKARVTAELDTAARNGAALRRALKAEYGRFKEPPAATLKLIDDVLKGKVSVNKLPEGLREHVVTMRNHIKYTSRLLIDSGVVPESMIPVFAKNMESYMTRSYRIFDDTKWAKKVVKKYPEIINKVKGVLMTDDPSLTNAQAQAKVKALISDTKGTPFDLVRSGSVTARELGILMKRKNIDPSIRELFGEYRDPNVNYLRSINKMSYLSESHSFLTDVKKMGMDKFLFEGFGQGKHDTLVAPEGSNSPLAGLRSTPEIAKALQTMDAIPSNSVLMKGLIRASGTVKAAKTIGSMITHVRNFTANPLLQVSQGYMNPLNFGRSFKALGAKVTAATPWGSAKWVAKTEDMMNEYIKLGIIGDSARAGELTETIKDAAGRDLRLDDIVASQELGGRLKPLRIAKNIPRNIRKGIVGAYRFEDDFYKIFAYESELQRYKKAFPERANDPALKQQVAEIVKQTQPTYSRVPEIVKKIRRNPFIGSFVSFPAEIIRTQFNTLEMGIKEMKNARTRSIGAQRLGGLMAAHALSLAVPALIRNMKGITKDEEEDLRKHVPFWSENSQLIILDKNDKGEYKFIDTGYSNPLAQLHKPIMAALRGENATEASVEFAKEFLQPFISEDILTSSILDVRRNSTKEGRQIYNPQDSLGTRVVKQMKHIGKGFVPGTMESASRVKQGITGKETRFGKKRDAKTELLALFTGTRIETLDVAQSVKYRLGDLNRDARNARRIWTSVATRNGPVTDKELAKALKDARGAMASLLKEGIENVDSAERLGVSSRTIRKAMSDWKMPLDVRRAVRSRDENRIKFEIPSGAKSIKGRRQQIRNALRSK